MPLPVTQANSRAWPALAALSFVAAAAFLFFFRPIQDDDAWLHFAAGRWILEHGTIPRTDMFTCTAPGVPYVDHEWLAQVLFESVRRIAGLEGFRVLIALCGAFCYVIFARSALAAGASPRAAAGGALTSLLLQWHVARARPQALTLVCVALLVYYFIIKPRPPARRPFLAFSLIIIFWANVHAACVIAPALLAAAAVGAWISGLAARARDLWIWTALSAALLCVNPYGIQVYTYALETQGLAALIPEWKPLVSLLFDPVERARASAGSDFRTQVILAGALAAATIAGAAFIILQKRKAPADNDTIPAAAATLSVLSVVMALLPFQANRHALFIMIPTAFATASVSLFAGRSRTAATSAACAGWLAIVVVATGLVRDVDYRLANYNTFPGGYFANTWPPASPVGSVRFIQKAHLDGNCWSRPSWGGYLLYHLYPGVRVSYDGRITTLGAALYEEHVAFFQGRNCAAIAEKYQIDWIVVPPWMFGRGRPRDNPQFAAPALNADFEPVYIDAAVDQEGSAVVALRRSSARFAGNLAKARAVR